ncbi:MAG: hypothetical protein JXR73_11495 [Candidatus Omnitrophica bacterium]|nr:hypothetical protein [Candidatus Omnitrophota bacterium]
MPLSLSQHIHDYLLQEILNRHGDAIDIRLRIQQGDSAFLQRIARELDQSFSRAGEEIRNRLNPGEAAQYNRAIQDAFFCKRIKDAVLEDVYGERLCPQLDILPFPMLTEDSRHPAAFGATIEEIPVYAVCFEHPANICNELYPLMIDSYVCDLSKYWRRRRCIIGVHADWLDIELRAGRCIYYRPEEDRIIETTLDEPLAIHTVHFLAVSPQGHRLWGERFSGKKIFQINPFSDSAKADDKYACIRIWEKDGVPTPQAFLLSQNEVGSDEQLIDQIKDIFDSLFEKDAGEEIALLVQPNRGTEGRGVESFTGPRDWRLFSQQIDALFEHIRQIAREDDVLFRRGVRNVLLQDPSTGQNVCFDLRVNVACGRMESGFIMAAPPGAIISSPGRGGRILEYKPETEWKLYGLNPPGLVSWNEGLWHDIQETAEAAAAQFERCKLAGVDIRLEQRDGKIAPLVLDINPRPAGLAHSRYFDTREPGVSQFLWDFLPDSPT